jgi:16S rRNA (cytidine1402-2'-O)-methyltransferase
MAGTLFVVATPLGNLADWSPRARQTVAEADAVLVEDTRVSSKLFAAAGLAPRMRVFEKHRERRELEPVLALLREGKQLALLTDAGTPAIADPGALLVDAALAEGHTVIAVPGPSILAAALSVAGEETLPITFHGYPAEKRSERDAAFHAIRGAAGAHVFLVPPHDCAGFLTELTAILPGRLVVLCRELTKVHEEVVRGTAAEVLARLRRDEALRGEMALVVRAAPVAEAAAELADLAGEARRLQAAYGLHGKDLSDFLAFQAGVPRRTAYRAVQQLKDDAG